MFKIDLIKELQDEATKMEIKQENLLAEANKLIVFPENIDQKRTIDKIFTNLTEDVKKLELKKNLKILQILKLLH